MAGGMAGEIICWADISIDITAQDNTRIIHGSPRIRARFENQTVQSLAHIVCNSCVANFFIGFRLAVADYSPQESKLFT